MFHHQAFVFFFSHQVIIGVLGSSKFHSSLSKLFGQTTMETNEDQGMYPKVQVYDSTDDRQTILSLFRPGQCQCGASAQEQCECSQECSVEEIRTKCQEIVGPIAFRGVKRYHFCEQSGFSGSERQSRKACEKAGCEWGESVGCTSTPTVRHVYNGVVQHMKIFDQDWVDKVLATRSVLLNRPIINKDGDENGMRTVFHGYHAYSLH